LPTHLNVRGGVGGHGVVDAFDAVELAIVDVLGGNHFPTSSWRVIMDLLENNQNYRSTPDSTVGERERRQKLRIG
jgi:hypothetical protein